MMHALGGADLPSSRLAEADPDKPVTLPVHYIRCVLLNSTSASLQTHNNTFLSTVELDAGNRHHELSIAD